MRLLSAIHRWAGGLLGLLLALLGLTGTILVWEGAWTGLPGASDRVVEDVGAMAAIAERAAEEGKLSRVTFASEEIGLHQIVHADGSGAYVRQDGTLADRWASQWERPELWIFDLHHRLLAGDTGETVTGIAGLAGILFVLTGAVLWWRSRRGFRPTLLPARFAPGPIVRHHRDLGIVAAPLLLVSLVTGVLMLFEPLRQAVIGAEVRPEAGLAAPAPGAASPIEAALRSSKARFPSARLRRLTLPSKAGEPIAVRMKQAAEWTPNGRTQLTFDSVTGAPLSVQDPLAGNRAARIAEKLYPVHSAKVGGLAVKLLMSLSGLALTLLGSLAAWSFWCRRAARRRRHSSERMRTVSPTRKKSTNGAQAASIGG